MMESAAGGDGVDIGLTRGAEREQYYIHIICIHI